MKKGDVFYTKKIKYGTHRRATEVTVKGHVIGLLIGHKPDHVPNINENQMWSLIAEAGLVGLDHIGEALGKEEMTKVMTYVAKKFNMHPPKIEKEISPTEPEVSP